MVGIRRHGNRTVNGDINKRQFQERYEKWWLNKYIDYSPMSINDVVVKGEIIKVEYVGNSVYGTVILTLDNGCKYIVSSSAYKPRKTDVNIIDKSNTQ